MALRRHASTHEFFALVNGSLKASTLKADGRETILAALEPGNRFGGISLLDGLPRTHDITALKPTHLLLVSATDFAQLMHRNDFCVLLAGRIRALSGMVEDATLRSTRAHVECGLLLLDCGEMTHASREGHAGEVRSTVPVSRETLAICPT